jgi:hypothetical protein
MQNTHDYNVIRSEIEELPSPPDYQLPGGTSPVSSTNVSPSKFASLNFSAATVYIVIVALASVALL